MYIEGLKAFIQHNCALQSINRAHDNGLCYDETTIIITYNTIGTRERERVRMWNKDDRNHVCWLKVIWRVPTKPYLKSLLCQDIYYSHMERRNKNAWHWARLGHRIRSGLTLLHISICMSSKWHPKYSPDLPLLNVQNSISELNYQGKCVILWT